MPNINFPKQGPPRFQADPPNDYEPGKSKNEPSTPAEAVEEEMQQQFEEETIKEDFEGVLKEGVLDKLTAGDKDLYGGAPTEYGALYVVNNYGGYLFDNQFDISWTSTSERIFGDLVGEYTRRQGEATTALKPPGIFIVTNQAYTPGADNTTWDTGLSETGQLYSLAQNDMSYGLWPISDLFEYDYSSADIQEYAMADANNANSYTLEQEYINYTYKELYFLNQKFGYSEYYSAANLEQEVLDKVIDLAQSVITDEISNQVINKVIDYKDLSTQDLTSIAGTEAAQASTPGLTSAATAYGNGNGSTTTSTSTTTTATPKDVSIRIEEVIQKVQKVPKDKSK